MHQNECSLVLNVQVSAYLEGRDTLSCVAVERDSGEIDSEWQFVVGEDRTARDAERMLTGFAAPLFAGADPIMLQGFTIRANGLPIRPARLFEKVERLVV